MFEVRLCNPAVKTFFGVAFELRHKGEGCANIIPDHFRIALGAQAIDLPVQKHHLSVEVIEGANAEIALLADPANRRIGAVDPLDEGCQGRRDEHRRPGLSRWDRVYCRLFRHFGVTRFLAVAAVDRRLKAWARSARGTHIALSAPGVAIWSAEAGGEGRFRDGTSFASPFVAAAVAVLKVQSPRLKPADIAERLRGSAKDLGEAGSDPVFGAGLVQWPACDTPR